MPCKNNNSTYSRERDIYKEFDKQLEEIKAKRSI